MTLFYGHVDSYGTIFVTVNSLNQKIYTRPDFLYNDGMTTPATTPDYSPLLQRIADGHTVSDACRFHNIDRAMFYRDVKGIPDLREQLAIAQELGSEAMADTLVSIQARVRDPLMARVVSDNIRWLLSKRATERYGDHIGAKDSGNNDLTAILKEAIARIPRPDHDPAPAIEAESVTISDILGEGNA